MVNILTSVLLFGLPFVYFPKIFSPFEAPKVIIAEIVIIILTFVFFATEKKLPGKKTFLLVLGFIFLLSVIHLALNPFPYTFFGNPVRLQGTFLLWNLLMLSLVSSSVPSRLDKKVLSVAFLANLVIAFILPTNVEGRLYGIIGEPNSLAGYFLFLWPLLFIADLKKPRFNKIFVAIGAVIAGIMIFFTGSRSGLIGLFTQLVFITFTSLKKARPGINLAISLFILFLTVFLPFLDFQGKFQSRVRIWETAITAGLEKPVIGHGFGNVEYALKDAAINLKNSLRFEYVDSSHNIFLDWFVQGGIIGIFLFSYLFFSSLILLLRKKNYSYLISLLGITSVLLFNPVSVTILVSFWWILGKAQAQD